jgi:hypothetical protein
MTCEQVVEEELDELLSETVEPQVTVFQGIGCSGLRFPAKDSVAQKHIKTTHNDIGFEEIGSIHVPNHMTLRIQGRDNRTLTLYPGLYDDVRRSLLVWDGDNSLVGPFDIHNVLSLRAIPTRSWQQYLVDSKRAGNNYVVGNYEARFNINDTSFKAFCETDPSRVGCEPLVTLNRLKEDFPQSWSDMCLNYITPGFDPKRQYIPAEAKICTGGKADCLQMLRDMDAKGELDEEEDTHCLGTRYENRWFTSGSSSSESKLAQSKVVQNKDPRSTETEDETPSSAAWVIILFVILGVFIILALWTYRTSSRTSSRPFSEFSSPFKGR